MTNETPVPQEKVQQIFNTVINGTVQNLASGSTNVEQKATFRNRVELELFTKLLDAVREANLAHPLHTEVCGAIEELRSASGTPEFKDKYHRFMGMFADHIQVLGPFVAPFLAPLGSMLP